MTPHISIRKLASSLIVLAAAPFTFAADPAPDAAAMDKARMDAAVQFAETALKYGRDTYGEKHTPLFSDTLNRAASRKQIPISPATISTGSCSTG